MHSIFSKLKNYQWSDDCKFKKKLNKKNQQKHNKKKIPTKIITQPHGAFQQISITFSRLTAIAGLSDIISRSGNKKLTYM